MRSWPVTEAMVVLALGLLLLFPMLRVTGGAPNAHGHHQGSETTAPDFRDTSCWLTVRSPHEIKALRIVCEGDEVLVKEGAFKQVEESLTLPISITGIELLVEASWPAGTPETMVEVLLEPDQRDVRRNSIWGEEQVEDILSFQWHE